MVHVDDVECDADDDGSRGNGDMVVGSVMIYDGDDDGVGHHNMVTGR